MFRGAGSLDYVPKRAVRTRDVGTKGIHWHNLPILPREPPFVQRAKPRFSVGQMGMIHFVC